MKPNSICLIILSLTLSLLGAYGQGYSQPTRMTSPSGSARASLSRHAPRSSVRSHRRASWKAFDAHGGTDTTNCRKPSGCGVSG